MNVELLRKIAAVIQEKPELFDMQYFNWRNSCGTSHCIGGWAEDMTGLPMQEALNISNLEARRLFYVDGDFSDEEEGDEGGWPKQFHGVPEPWKPTPQQAAARIEHFIATNGAE